MLLIVLLLFKVLSIDSMKSSNRYPSIITTQEEAGHEPDEELGELLPGGLPASLIETHASEESSTEKKDGVESPW